ncbi:MAG: ATP-dependent Clp protease ATP-binding subunit [Leptospiraceae bacterium]|nr:ATP-dependent Clp protease ATP-binding subunit [Leptospiraceae bacterium]MCP5494570.1 ATP-dependent Clp protease ATP-binding subunit [Leptospiraceae bacterium]
MSSFGNHRIFREVCFHIPGNRQFLLYGNFDDVCHHPKTTKDSEEIIEIQESIKRYLKYQLECELILTYKLTTRLQGDVGIKKFAQVNFEGDIFDSWKEEERLKGGEDAVNELIDQVNDTNTDYTSNAVIGKINEFITSKEGKEKKWGIIIPDFDQFIQSISVSDKNVSVQYITEWRLLDNVYCFFLSRDEDLKKLPIAFQKNSVGYAIQKIPEVLLPEIKFLFRESEKLQPKPVENVLSYLINTLKIANNYYLFSIRSIIQEFKLKNHGKTKITFQEIRELICPPSNNPWEQVVNLKLNSLFQDLNKEIIGQDFAKERWKHRINNIKTRLEERKSKVEKDKEPLAKMFFAGPPGVGKTEFFRFMQRKFALYNIGFIHFGMERYSTDVDVERFWGAHESFRGNPNGELGSAILENPYTVVLFDEFDRAHTSILQRFLGLLEGEITTGSGIKLDLSNCVLIFTSNIGHEKFKEVGEEKEEAKKIIHENIEIVAEELSKKSDCGPLISRLKSHIIPFSYLTKKEAKNLIKIKLESIVDWFESKKEKKRELKFDPNVQSYFEKQYELQDKSLGARHIVAQIQDKVKEKLEVLIQEGREGERVYIAKDGEIELSKTVDNQNKLDPEDPSAFDFINPWKNFIEKHLDEIINSLEEKLAGQKNAILEIRDHLRGILYRLQKNKNKSPLGYIFLAGPTGVGKTETFRILKSHLPPEIKTRVFDMTQYSDDATYSRFIGPPPGFVGYDKNPKGELGSFIDTNKACVILFDEFEKANITIWTTFLSLLEGSLTVSDGTKIDLSQTFFIFTSNAGTNPFYLNDEKYEMKYLAEDDVDKQEAILKYNKNVIAMSLQYISGRLEFVGRIKNRIIFYFHISKNQMEKIVRERVKFLEKEDEYNCEIDDSVVDMIVSEILEDKEYGMRMLVDKLETFTVKLESLLVGVKEKVTIITDGKNLKIKGQS